jgi:hypothetical protein
MSTLSIAMTVLTLYDYVDNVSQQNHHLLKIDAFESADGYYTAL